MAILRDKIIAVVTVTVLVLGLGIASLLYISLTRVLTERIHGYGIVIAEDISRHSVDFLLKGDLPGLQKMVTERRGRGKYFAYALIADIEGQVLAHTFKDKLPWELVEVHKVPPGQTINIQSVDIGGKMVCDVAVPIFTKEGIIGTIRVGISKEYVIKTIADMMKAIIKIVALSMVIGIVIAVGLANVITRPLSRLANAVRAIGIGNLEHRVDIKTNDEIGQLGHVLNQMTADLKKSNAQLIQSSKLAAVGQLGASVAHELNNPLTGILGYAQYTLEKIRKPGFQAEDFKSCEKYLGYIEKEAVRCKLITENLLKFSRRSPEELELLDINQVIEDALVLLSHQLMLKKIELKKELSSDLKPVEGNAKQLQQVFANLVINSQYAMPGGGNLTVATRLKDERSSSEANFVEISFTDIGCGIPLEILDKIFDPFFTTKTGWTGAGLGLSVSYTIIQSHKGRIEVKSEVDKGTTFTIILPTACAGGN